MFARRHASDEGPAKTWLTVIVNRPIVTVANLTVGPSLALVHHYDKEGLRPHLESLPYR